MLEQIMWLFMYFNPRSLTGATRAAVFIDIRKAISIHAPSRERHLPLSLYQNIHRISIHAPSRERRSVAMLYTLPINFNPRSLTGATKLRIAKKIQLLFQSTLPHGSDIEIRYTMCNVQISIHAPSRERPK